MNMKKVLASVAAGALAVTTLATAAFADTISVVQKGGTIYNATFTYTTATATVALTGDGEVKTGSITAEAVKTEGAITVGDYTVSGTALNAKGENVTLAEQKVEAGKTATYKLTTAAGSLDGEVTNMPENVSYKLTYVVALSRKDGTAFEANDSYTFGGVTGKLVVNDNTADGDAGLRKTVIGTEDTRATNTTTITKQQARDLHANGGKVVFTTWQNADTYKAPTIVTVKVSTTVSGIDAKEYYITLPVATNAPIEVAIPAGWMLHTGDETTDYDQVTIEFIGGVAGAEEGDAVHGAGWSWGAWNAELIFDSSAPSTTEPEPEETTTPEETKAPDVNPDPEPTQPTQPADPTPAPGGQGGQGGNDNPPTGVVLAVIPAIVAAAGVVVSKKRK